MMFSTAITTVILLASSLAAPVPQHGLLGSIGDALDGVGLGVGNLLGGIISAPLDLFEGINEGLRGDRKHATCSDRTRICILTCNA